MGEKRWRFSVWGRVWRCEGCLQNQSFFAFESWRSSDNWTGRSDLFYGILWVQESTFSLHVGHMSLPSRLCAYRALRTTRNPLPTHQRLQFKHWCWNGYSGLILENSGQSICMTFKFNPSFGALGSSFRLWLALIFWLWRARWERNKQGD